MATRFSFLSFPQSKSLWIPLLTLLDNLLLTIGHHSHLPPAFQGHTSGQAQPSAHLGSEGDSVMRRTNLSVYALER